jgi:hydroxypyruvate reductase
MSRFDPAVLDNDPERRRVIVDLLDVALDAVDPYAVTSSALHLDDDVLVVGGDSIDLADIDRVIVLGMGKAAPPMASAVADALAHLQPRGVVAAAAFAPVPADLELVVGSHPVPDDSSSHAGQRLLQLAAEATERDLVVAVISGGGSALAEVTVDGIGVAEVAAVTESLLRAAVPIDQINAVRTRLSRLKGGGLGAAAAEARLVTLVLSDVVGNPLHVVASGPTLVPPPGTEVAADVAQLLPASARRALDAFTQPVRHARHTACLVADGTTAAKAMVTVAAARGIDARLSEEALHGEAHTAAVRVLESAAAEGLVVFVGETVVDVTGPGSGGRNQELALAAAIAADGDGGVVVAALATDGVDGPTSAAGAVVDGATVARARRLGFDPEASLVDNDAGPLLDAVGELLVCGPTGTNVADLAVAWRAGTSRPSWK